MQNTKTTKNDNVIQRENALKTATIEELADAYYSNFSEYHIQDLYEREKMKKEGSEILWNSRAIKSAGWDIIRAKKALDRNYRNFNTAQYNFLKEEEKNPDPSDIDPDVVDRFAKQASIKNDLEIMLRFAGRAWEIATWGELGSFDEKEFDKYCASVSSFYNTTPVENANDSLKRAQQLIAKRK